MTVDAVLHNHLIIYAKRPLPGYAKTRLGAVIGMDSSAGVYARLLYSYLYDLLYSGSTFSIELSVASQKDVEYFKYAFPELSVVAQTNGDLGSRMARSFQQAFQNGAHAVALTGSDIPGLNSSLITRAFTLLENHRGVIGPAEDGGYYLIGLRAPGYGLFHGIEWSSPDVLTQTEILAQQQELQLIQLPMLKDMDDSEDYWNWRDRMMLRNL
ncbi:MAG: TIGR04282 family arsenosugar biosynthesis glycosyltransferase [Anaerolineae bacterium]|nr:TIGR04282 family arsenosugar biosynthesis glycosyltransferase [Anaerolineae bacterium]